MSCVNKQYSAIQLRRGLASEFEVSNIILASGEPAFATDDYTFKIGDGNTPWNNLDSLATLSYVNDLLSVNDAILFKGTLGTNGTIENLPSIYQAGWAYKVITDGTYAGKNCQVGDLIIAGTDRLGGNGSDEDWIIIETNIENLSEKINESLVNFEVISNPCDTSHVVITDTSNSVKRISINELNKAMSEIDGGGVTYTGC